MVSGAKQRHGTMDGRHPGTGGSTPGTAFECGQILLQSITCRVTGPCVVVAAGVLQIVPVERGTGVDRGNHAVELIVFMNARVDGPGFKVHGQELRCRETGFTQGAGVGGIRQGVDRTARPDCRQVATPGFQDSGSSPDTGYLRPVPGIEQFV